MIPTAGPKAGRDEPLGLKLNGVSLVLLEQGHDVRIAHPGAHVSSLHARVKNDFGKRLTLARRHQIRVVKEWVRARDRNAGPRI